MQIIFRNVKTNQELIMPVTPPDFTVAEGRAVETLDMTDTGQVNFPGLKSLFYEQMEFLLPASGRNYTTGGWTGEPYAVADRLVEWSNNGDVLRFIVTDTPVNLPVLLGPVGHGQRDGTGDVYVTLELRQYRELAEANGIKNANLIYPGQVVKLPDKGSL